MAITPQSMQKQRDDLYNQVKQASQQQAQANYQTGLSGLRQQMQQQRLNMNSARGQIAEQGAMNQRSIESQMAARGLGSSGIKDLAGLQSQLAQGQGINQLEQQNQLVQQEALNTQRSLSNELTNNLRAADLTHADQMVQSSEKTYAQEQQDKQYLNTSVLNLAEMLQGGASSEDVKTWGKLMGIDLDSLDASTQEALHNLGLQNADLIQEIASIPDDTMEALRNTQTGVGIGTMILGGLAIAAGVGLAPFSGGTSLTLTAAGLAGLGVGGIGVASGNQGVFTNGNKATYTLGGNNIEASSREEAVRKLTDYYSKYGEVGSGTVKLEVDSHGRVKFKYRNETYSTFGEARAAVRNAPK